MNYQYIIRHKELFPSVIGITYRQFELLLPKFSSALRLAEHKKAYEKERKRDVGAGRKPALKTDRQKLFFIFLYYKVYPTFRFAQIVFEFDSSNIYHWVKFLEKVLFAAIGYELSLPRVRVKSLAGFLEVCPGLRNFIVDATERRIKRPKDPTIQNQYYSGKKKYHTVKNQVYIHPFKRTILAVSKTVEGKLHDKKLLEQDGLIYRAPPKACGIGDLGYQGAKELNPFISFATPLKKEVKKELTLAQKATNKALSSIRVRAEHPLSYLKHFNILSQTFRGNIAKTHQPFVNLACLYNFTRRYR